MHSWVDREIRPATIENMPTSIHHYPLTGEQRTQLEQDLKLIQERLQAIDVLMHACYGDDSQAAIRADEVDAALQRLKWELERLPKAQTAA
jgi:hypothetical protein